MFPERLKALRRGSGLTLTQLAVGLNQSQKLNHNLNSGPQIGSWERGINTPSYLEVRKLAEFFHVSIDFLVGQTNDELIDLEDLFARTATLSYRDKILSGSDRYEVIQMIQGYLMGKYQPYNLEENDDLALPLEDENN